MVPCTSIDVNGTPREALRAVGDDSPREHDANPMRPTSSIDLERLEETLDDALTVAEIARVARVAPNTVRCWQDAGCRDRAGVLHRLPFVIVGARRRYTHRRDLADFLGAMNAVPSS